MKVMIVDGYLREAGKTAAISDKLYTMLNDKGVEVSTVGLRDRTIADCRDCGGCAGGAGCVIKDDMQQLFDRVRSADAIILTSPVYMWGITGLAKVFLDRLYCMTDDLEDKKLGLVVTAGSDPFSGCEIAVEQVRRFGDYFGMENIDPLYSAPSTDPLPEARVEKFIDDILSEE